MITFIIFAFVVINIIIIIIMILLTLCHCSCFCSNWHWYGVNDIKKNLSLFTETSQESQNQPTLLWNLVSTLTLNFMDVYLFLSLFTVCRCGVCSDFLFFIWWFFCLNDGWRYLQQLVPVLSSRRRWTVLRYPSCLPPAPGPFETFLFCFLDSFLWVFVWAGTDFCLVKNCSDFCKLWGYHFKDNCATYFNCSQEIWEASELAWFLTKVFQIVSTGEVVVRQSGSSTDCQRPSSHRPATQTWWATS